MSGEEPPRHGGDRPARLRLVPVDAPTGGRTRSVGRELPIESVVTVTNRARRGHDLRSVTDRARRGHDLRNEHRTILALASGPLSLVEIGAVLTVPVTDARVLVSDLVEWGYLDVHAPPPAFAGERPSAAVLTRLLGGLRAR